MTDPSEPTAYAIRGPAGLVPADQRRRDLTWPTPVRTVLVMAEHSASPLWDRPGSGNSLDNLSGLGLTDALVDRLVAWNQQFERLAFTDFEWQSDDVQLSWVRRGLELAHELQQELGSGSEVRYFHDDDPRTMAERLEHPTPGWAPG